VKIEPEAFFKAGKVAVGYQCMWKVLPMFVDVWEGKGGVVTVAQGLANGKHTLKLIHDLDSRAAIRAIRVYRPPVQ